MQASAAYKAIWARGLLGRMALWGAGFALLFVLGAALAACDGSAGVQTGLPQAQPTVIGPLSGPVPPTETPVMPPGYKSPTPIPPEHLALMVPMGTTAFGTPAIQPGTATPGSTALPVSREDVRQYVEAHKMERRAIGAISDGEPQLVSVEQAQLIEVYRRYIPVVLSLPQWPLPLPPETPVYIAMLQGTFRVVRQREPPGSQHPVFGSGVMVFDARTGYELMEGGVGLINTTVPETPSK